MRDMLSKRKDESLYKIFSRSINITTTDKRKMYSMIYCNRNYRKLCLTNIYSTIVNVF